MTRVLAVDPGLTGALACYDDELTGLVLQDMPIAQRRTGGGREILEAELARIIRSLCPDEAVVERVHSLPKQGVVSTFNFGVGYGIVKGILAALSVPTTFMTPQEWRRIARVDGTPGDKGASRIRASQLYPAQASMFFRSKDHGRADAALLAYAYMQSRNNGAHFIQNILPPCEPACAKPRIRA
jgi:hypothetical protein